MRSLQPSSPGRAGVVTAVFSNPTRADAAYRRALDLGYDDGVVLAVEPPTPAEASTIQRVWQEAGGEYFHCARTGGRANTG
ncbi:MAG TPA: hypothetical protein VM778_03690 [Gemmatimonadota bacterium]|nr:hypothetical protein [Gemmatimonadota bacterium]